MKVNTKYQNADQPYIVSLNQGEWLIVANLLVSFFFFPQQRVLSQEVSMPTIFL